MYRLFVLTVQALKNSAVLTVHRQDLYTLFLCQRHNNMAGRHQRLLVGERDIFSRLHGRNGGPYSNHADDGRHHDLRVRLHGRRDQPIHAAYHLHRQIADRQSKRLRLLLFPHTDNLRMKLPDLFFQKYNINASRQSGYFYILLSSHHFQGLCSDGTG